MCALDHDHDRIPYEHMIWSFVVHNILLVSAISTLIHKNIHIATSILIYIYVWLFAFFSRVDLVYIHLTHQVDDERSDWYLSKRSSLQPNQSSIVGCRVWLFCELADLKLFSKWPIKCEKKNKMNKFITLLMCLIVAGATVVAAYDFSDSDFSEFIIQIFFTCNISCHYKLLGLVN